MGGPQQRTGLAGKQKGRGSVVFEESEVDMSRLFSQMPLVRRDRATKSRSFFFHRELPPMAMQRVVPLPKRNCPGYRL